MKFPMLPFRSLLTRKILFGIVPVFLLFIAVSVALQNHFQGEEMLEQAQVSAHTYADIIRESLVSMMVSNLEVDSTFLDQLTHIRQFDTVHVIVNNLKLREDLLTPDRVSRLEMKYRTLAPRTESEQNVLASGLPQFSAAGGEFRAIIPFNATKVCQKCHAVPVGYTLGATALRVSLAHVSEAAAGNWRRSMLIFVCFAALVIAAASIMFRRYVSRPVDRLVTATQEIRSGNLDVPVLPDAGTGSVPGQQSDELVILALRFDEMRRTLKEKIDQIDATNRALSQRNADLEQALSRLRKAQEDLVRSERLAVTGKMTAQLSHEINNPIHNIQSLLESTIRKLGPEEQPRELVSVALEEVSRLAKLTRQMLEFYRGSIVEPDREPVDIAGVVEAVIRAHRDAFVTRGIDIRLDLQPSPIVRGSSDKLTQVLLNLMLNARDAMPDGGTIAVRAKAASGMVRIEVIDTGVGIPQENMGRIFDAFFTTKKQASGVGLGLAVCYGIVQQHNGTISAVSEPGKGSTFIVELPASGDRHE
jgi:signal transduction histidine kinase